MWKKNVNYLRDGVNTYADVLTVNTVCGCIDSEHVCACIGSVSIFVWCSEEEFVTDYEQPETLSRKIWIVYKFFDVGMLKQRRRWIFFRWERQCWIDTGGLFDGLCIEIWTVTVIKVSSCDTIREAHISVWVTRSWGDSVQWLHENVENRLNSYLTLDDTWRTKSLNARFDSSVS